MIPGGSEEGTARGAGGSGVARGGREALAAVAALASYATTALPATRRELRRWRGRAEAIPDARLRRHALAALEEKGSNVEAVAVFATLAPLRRRARALRAIAALQVAIDFLDSVEEDAGVDPPGSEEGRSSPVEAPLSTMSEQGGHATRYLDELEATWRGELAALPAGAALLPHVDAAVARCAAGQRHTHAAAPQQPRSNAVDLAQREEVRPSGTDALRDWALGLGAPAGYRWWEVAAGASSSVAAHALIAAAADPRTAPSEAAAIDAAYFPPVGALTVLLDDLVDLDQDRAAGEHNYVEYYGGGEEAAERLAAIAAAASPLLASLRRRGRHAAILAGVAAFYLSAPEAETPFAAPIRARLLSALGAEVAPLAAFLRLRRRF